uniref:Beta_helix domain-containing protein n=1 Tax=Syphacia muris TaxID=451379 RepID=A0A0N5B025_9BILA
MVLQHDGGKLFVKVERGTKPRIKRNGSARKALVTIPCSHVANWPVLKEQMDNGVTIIVQRLEHQYKIIIQHVLDKKPSVCVYVNSVANEKNLKTSVKLINTQMAHIGIAGPNLEVAGTIKAQKVTFESTFGALHTNAKLTARYVALNAQHIFIKPEAMYCCQTLKMWSRKVQVDGRIFPTDKNLEVLVDSALLHIGVDGMIGGFRSPLDGMVAKSSENTAEYLKLKLKGSLANYGKIFSKDCIDMKIDGSILSLEDDRLDSAGRGYTALKQIKGIASTGSSSLPTSSKLSKAIETQKPDTVAQLLEEGVDPNDIVIENSVRSTPKKMAGLKYRKIRVTERRNKFREKITVIQALMVTHDWRRGLIMSNSIVAKVDRDCEDCAQFRATKLELTTCGNAQCELNSIWTCESVNLHIGNDLVIEGQVKNQDFSVECNGEVCIQRDGIVSQKNSAKIVCSELTVCGIWCVGEQINVMAVTALFSNDSYVESNFIGIKLERDCNHGGVWQTSNLELVSNGILKTMHDGKVLCDDTAKISTFGFNCVGVWKVAESFQINVEESMSFQSKSEVTCNTLKIINKGCCVHSGFLGVRHMQTYVRNDFITTETGRTVIGVMGTVAAGAFRNDGSWVSEHNLRLEVACFEQSEDAIIHAKDSLELAVYDNSIAKNHGRIVADVCSFRINQKVRFDGYIRVNHMEVYLQYCSESQCVIGGQLEVNYGPLVIKGRSEISSTQSSITGHSFPGFILEGQLKAEAVIAPFVAVRFATESYALLSGMSSILDETPYKTFISASAIYTMRASFIDSSSTDGYPEAILCASNWIHEGQIRFKGSRAYIIADTFVNRGRLTNEGRLQNHMRSVYVSVMSKFENGSVFSADEIYISGVGELENKNRIFATETMQIKLPSFSDESLQQSLENTKLLSAEKEWLKVNGQINPKGKLDIQPPKLVMKIKNINFRNQIRLKAQALLQLTDDIIDEKVKVYLSARDAVIFDNCKLVTESTEIEVGDAYETEVMLPESSSLHSNYLRISGRCKQLTVFVDGIIECDSIIFDSGIKNVKLVGEGTLISKNSLNFNGGSVTLSLAELYASEILGAAVYISPKGFAKILPVETTTATTIFADSCTIEGKVFTHGKLNLKSGNGTVHVNADLIGTNLMSEVSVEGNDVIFVGSISNLEFLEVYARRRFEYCETATIGNVKNIAVEAETVAFNGKFSVFNTVIITAEDAIIEGDMFNKGFGSASIFGRNIRFDGTCTGLSSVEFSGRADTYIAGTVSEIGSFCVDSKWIYCKSDILSCDSLKFAGYSVALDGSINADNVAVNALGAIFLLTSLRSGHCFLTGAFVFAFNGTSVPVETEVSAIIYITNSYFNIKNTAKVHTTILFTPTVNQCAGSKEQWENTIEVFKQSFQSVDEDFMISTLGCKNTLNSSTYLFPIQSQFFDKMKSLVDRFRIEHTSIFNPFELLDVMYQQTDTFDSCRSEQDQLSRTSFETGHLTETWNNLKTQLTKSALQSPQSSVDDYGYGSRSSSEDNDEKTSLRASPTVSLTKCNENDGLLSASNIICEAGYDGFSNYNQYLSVPYSISASNDGSSTDRECEDSEKEDETSYVFNGEHKVPIVRIDFEVFDIAISKPRFEIPRQPTPTADLALKKLQVKTAISTLDLRSFGSESSLASFSTVEYVTPAKVVRTPLRRSMIPRSSLRKTTTVV